MSKPKPRKAIKPKTRKVRAGDGLRLPIPPGIAINSLDRIFSDDRIVEVVDCAFVRRRIRVKDLVKPSAAEEKAFEAKAKALKKKKDEAAKELANKQEADSKAAAKTNSGTTKG